MSSPDIKAARMEISALFDGLVGVSAAANLPYMPLAMTGKSPIVSTEDRGFRSFLASANPGMFDLYFAVVVRVNRDAHGAERAQEIFDDTRMAVIEIVTDTSNSFVNFEALEIPNGEFAPTFVELHDGIQYLVGEIPIAARGIICA